MCQITTLYRWFDREPLPSRRHKRGGDGKESFDEKYIVRSYEPGDEAFFLEMLFTYFGDGTVNGNDANLEIAPDGFIFAVDIKSNQPVGCVMMLDHGFRDELRIGELTWLVVDRAFRGQGIGYVLALEGLRRMKQAECAFVIVKVHLKNKIAKNLYRMLGFCEDNDENHGKQAWDI